MDDHKNIARDVLEAVKENNLGGFVDSSGKKNFKILVSALPMFPVPIANQLKSLKKISSTFDGKRGQKVNVTLVTKSIIINRKNTGP